MGMYDQFKAETECPYCGTRKEFTWQTKKFLQILETFEVGDDLEFEQAISEDQTVKYSVEGDLEVVGTTIHMKEDDSCGRSIHADIVIRSGEFARIENVRGEKYEQAP